MNKELFIFGFNSPTGRGVTSVLSNKEFNKIHLFNQGPPKELPDKDNVAYYEVKDLSKEENVIKAFNSIATSKDKYLFLFSAIGGFSGGKKVWEFDSNDLERMLNINLKANFYIAKHFARKVKECAGGSILFTSAYVGVHSEAAKSIYGATKAALIHFATTLAIEGKEINLTSNVIAPYIIDTPENRGWDKSGNYEGWIKPEELGEIVYDVFEKFNYYNSNVIELKTRFEIK